MPAPPAPCRFWSPPSSAATSPQTTRSKPIASSPSSLIDLYTLTKGLGENIGPEASDSLGARTAGGKPDRTHLGPDGQRKIGAIAALEFTCLFPQRTNH